MLYYKLPFVFKPNQVGLRTAHYISPSKAQGIALSWQWGLLLLLHPVDACFIALCLNGVRVLVLFVFLYWLYSKIHASLSFSVTLRLLFMTVSRTEDLPPLCPLLRVWHVLYRKLWCLSVHAEVICCWSGPGSCVKSSGIALEVLTGCPGVCLDRTSINATFLFICVTFSVHATIISTLVCSLEYIAGL